VKIEKFSAQVRQKKIASNKKSPYENIPWIPNREHVVAHSRSGRLPEEREKLNQPGVFVIFFFEEGGESSVAHVGGSGHHINQEGNTIEFRLETQREPR